MNEIFEPMRQGLTDGAVGPDMQQSIDRFLAFYMDRDRALEDYLTVAAAAVGSYFDAIVDGNLSASDPTNRQFIGIYEAVSYLGSLGLVNVTIGVKPTTSATAYTETASITNAPAKVRIIAAGIGGSFTQTPTGTTPVQWLLNGRSANFATLQVEGITMRNSNSLSNGAADLFNSTLTRLVLINCAVFASTNFTQLNAVSNDTDIFIINSTLSNMGFGRARHVTVLGGDIFISSSFSPALMHNNSGTPTGGTGSSYLCGVSLVPGSGSANVTWNNATNTANVTFAGCSIADRSYASFIPGGTSFNLTFVGKPTIDLTKTGSSHNLTVTLTSPSNGWDVTIRGAQQQASASTTIFTKTGTNYGTFRGTVAKLDVTGGARIEAALNSNLTVTGGSVLLRGSGINADISIQNNTATTAVQGIGLLRACVRVAFHTFSTMNQAWTLDASSVGNICDFAGASVATNPGVDSGSSNIIRQT
jgi:hypothetical protein